MAYDGGGVLAMALLLTPEAVPMKMVADGVVRVGGTRVTLDTVIGAYNDGASAAEIVDDYSSLRLADVEAVISYYLQHKDEVDAYLQEREARAAAIRAEHEARFPSQGIRERLLARRRSA
jgi:uncharacterized protein (DUF433 family)